MVGLTVLLENYRDFSAKTSPQVISKVSMMMNLPFSPSRGRTAGFLDHCFLCKHQLLPGKDIYMYKGDRAFCSVECRCRQISMDEDELSCTSALTGCTTREHNCSLAAMKQPQLVPTAANSPRCGKGAKNRTNAFAY